LIGEPPAFSEHQHGEQTTQPQCHAVHGHFAELAAFFVDPLTRVRQDCRRGRTTGVDVARCVVVREKNYASSWIGKKP
jgi:hypothetical protein